MQGSRKPLRDLFTRLIRQCDIGLGLLLSLIGVPVTVKVTKTVSRLNMKGLFPKLSREQPSAFCNSCNQSGSTLKPPMSYNISSPLLRVCEVWTKRVLLIRGMPGEFLGSLLGDILHFKQKPVPAGHPSLGAWAS